MYCIGHAASSDRTAAAAPVGVHTIHRKVCSGGDEREDIIEMNIQLRWVTPFFFLILYHNTVESNIVKIRPQIM